ncbi:hypothetical protein GLOIN_2v1838494 [Rhizophagus irregularis DAOM 181602=DAOM 197198]|uniref:Uncharacterized protein n=3 Tax=Rhizophagus irregularis TaxID=588596 RepID=A0A2H5U7L9_RHIID|nr:hypothetical protein GLOIN_2v1838494 [Rhizophagus irregularis DAOM 181602=DAOM 197198]POG75740.1 hypothetical protein GLOIN_2v1838494 [Rhizophagus irregularis DAOM 181602=DAOM 197198]GBC50843.1 hypothetical protein GLOIN_2v1838494 [Rhizophagus irregularis DAOM 181602=DAOM 197198]|eukprot:XP_025182606.1 hypothetical protein GLOIN_2v1838494 [Rhizophagus irregularis DAOM 181602=DAOM 197198]
MSSELEVLKQRIVELEAKNAELEAEKAELLKRIMEENNTRRDVRVEELEQKNKELETRLAIVEQASLPVKEQTYNDNPSDNSTSNFNSVTEYHEKPLVDVETDNSFPEEICYNKQELVAMVPANSAKRLNGKPLKEKDMDSFLLEAHKKIVSSEIKRRNKEKKNEKNGQGLIQEISSSVPKENHVTKISKTAWSRKSDNSNALVSSFHGTTMIEISQYLAQLCDKALIAEEHRLEANQEEILCWYHYGRNFVFQLEALCDNNKIGEKKARGLIYDEVVKQVNILRKKRSQNTGVPLPDITRDGLRKKTQRAEKIYKLLEKIGLDKIQYIKSYRDQVSESIAPIPLAHISNSSDDSKEVSPSNSLEAEDDYYKMLLEDCVYFDSTPKPVKETNEEVVSQSVKTDDDSNCNRNSDVCLKQSMPDDSDDDGYNGYGGYNEYGERDRGYYCCDGRYERKVSPMMSPIISPVTA